MDILYPNHYIIKQNQYEFIEIQFQSSENISSTRIYQETINGTKAEFDHLLIFRSLVSPWWIDIKYTSFCECTQACIDNFASFF